MGILLSSTGTTTFPLSIEDLGGLTFDSTIIDFDLEEVFPSINPIRSSKSLAILLDNNDITIKDKQNNVISTSTDLKKLDVDGIANITGGITYYYRTNPPTENDDNTQGYVKQDRWIADNKDEYVAFDVTTNNAIWKRTTTEDENGNLVVGGSLTFGNAIVIVISSNVNNLIIPNIESVYIVHLEFQGNYSLTGITAPNPKKNIKLEIFNTGVSKGKLKDQNSKSNFENRFKIGGNKTIQVDEGISLIYDTIDNKWRSTSINI